TPHCRRCHQSTPAKVLPRCRCKGDRLLRRHRFTSLQQSLLLASVDDLRTARPAAADISDRPHPILTIRTAGNVTWAWSPHASSDRIRTRSGSSRTPWHLRPFLPKLEYRNENPLSPRSSRMGTWEEWSNSRSSSWRLEFRR